MALYNIYASITGDLDNIEYCGTQDFATVEEAQKMAYNFAVSMYQSHEGHGKIKSWEDCRQKLENEGYQYTYNDVNDYYNKEMYKWLTFYAILASKDPKRPIIEQKNTVTNDHPIYVITAITDIYPSIPEGLHDYQLMEECRCVNNLGFHRSIGWFPTLDEAERALFQNMEPVHKSFNWFVIEETTPGFYAQVLSRTFYHWDSNNNCYLRTPKPDVLDDYPNLGLG